MKSVVVFAATWGWRCRRAGVATEISRLARSDSADDRTLAAHMLGEVDPGTWTERATLRALLSDPDPDVANEALAALRWPEEADLLPDVVGHLDHRRTAGAAVDVWSEPATTLLAIIDEGLRRDEHGRHAQELLVRAGREIGTSAAVIVLRGHVDHHDRVRSGSR